MEKQKVYYNITSDEIVDVIERTSKRVDYERRNKLEANGRVFKYHWKSPQVFDMIYRQVL